MLRIRRITAVLSSVLLLQLSLPGGAPVCAVHGEAEAGGHPHAMRGMSTSAPRSAPGNRFAATGAMPNASSAPGHGGNSQHDGGCQLPWAPPQCASMTACTVTAAPTATTLALGAAPRAASSLAEPPVMTSRPPAAPESPPPRS